MKTMFITIGKIVAASLATVVLTGCGNGNPQQPNDIPQPAEEWDVPAPEEMEEEIEYVDEETEEDEEIFFGISLSLYEGTESTYEHGETGEEITIDISLPLDEGGYEWFQYRHESKSEQYSSYTGCATVEEMPYYEEYHPVLQQAKTIYGNQDGTDISIEDSEEIRKVLPWEELPEYLEADGRTYKVIDVEELFYKVEAYTDTDFWNGYTWYEVAVYYSVVPVE